jgi:hypothetical protein
MAGVPTAAGYVAAFRRAAVYESVVLPTVAMKFA